MASSRAGASVRASTSSTRSHKQHLRRETIRPQRMERGARLCSATNKAPACESILQLGEIDSREHSIPRSSWQQASLQPGSKAPRRLVAAFSGGSPASATCPAQISHEPLLAPFVLPFHTLRALNHTCNSLNLEALEPRLCTVKGSGRGCNSFTFNTP